MHVDSALTMHMVALALNLAGGCCAALCVLLVAVPGSVVLVSYMYQYSTATSLYSRCALRLWCTTCHDMPHCRFVFGFEPCYLGTPLQMRSVSLAPDLASQTSLQWPLITTSCTQIG